MLRSRLLSTFTVIGAILIALSFVGLIVDKGFVYDPGQPVTGNEAWYYLIIGVLMVVNGLLTPPPPEEKSLRRAGGKSITQASSAAADKPLPRATAISAADKSGEKKLLF